MPIIDPRLRGLESKCQHDHQGSQQYDLHVEGLQLQSGKPNSYGLNIIISMRSINKYTLDVRREGFLKAIRTEQRQQIKAKKRAELLQAQDYAERLWRFRTELVTLDLVQQQGRVLEFLEFVEEQCNSEQFCKDLWAQMIMQELVELVGRSLVHDCMLQMPLLVQKLFEVIYRLLARCNFFFSIIQRKFATLVYAFYRHSSQNNLTKACQFFTCADNLIVSQSWRSSYDKQQLVTSQQVIERLLSLYVLEQSYTVVGEVQSTIVKTSPRWFRNAIKCMEVVYSLLQLDSERSQTWEAPIVREGLFEGLNVFMSKKDFAVQNFDPSETDSDSLCEQMRKVRVECEQTNLYFISIILDILLAMEKLMEHREVALLQDLLAILLRESDHCSVVNLTAIKIIKILYEQVIFDENDMQMLADSHPHLATLISAVVSSDYL